MCSVAQREHALFSYDLFFLGEVLLSMLVVGISLIRPVDFAENTGPLFLLFVVRRLEGSGAEQTPRS